MSKLETMKTLFLSLSSAVLLLFSSCTPEPQACISVNRTHVQQNEPLAFTSCALDAKRIVWNFGDGSVEVEGEQASHTYAQPGVYLVEMKALSKKDKKWDRTSVIINVDPYKTRYLTRLQINSFNINNIAGAPWDIAPGTWPDVYFEYGVAGSALRSTINPPINELQLNQCPVFWDFSSSVSKPILANNDYLIQMLDNDGTLLQPASEVMASFNLNPATATPSAPGVITLTNSNYQIELHFIEL
jgi:hypothetical protein